MPTRHQPAGIVLKVRFGNDCENSHRLIHAKTATNRILNSLIALVFSLSLLISLKKE